MHHGLKTTLLGIAAFFISIASAFAADESGIAIKDGQSIAFLGDSITWHGANHTGYCRLVVHGLETKGIRVKPIFAGTSGDKSSDMLIRLDLVLKHKPDHLFLSVGVNDIWHGESGVPLEKYKVFVPTILDRCKAAGTKVILSTITPITEDIADEKNVTAKDYNAYLLSLAKERNLPIALLHEAMFETITAHREKNRGNVVTFDGVHPGELGHRVMARGVLKAMGLNKEELDEIESKWNTSSQLLVIGDIQAAAGGRMGSWYHMLMEAMKRMDVGMTLRTMMTKDVRRKSPTLRVLLSELDAGMTDRVRHILLVPPLGDQEQKTHLDEYRLAVHDMIKLAAKHKCKLAIATFPIVADKPDSDVNVALRPYNDVLREVAKETATPLADLDARMQAYRTEHPTVPLTIGDARLSQPGGVLLAEAAYIAFGGDAASLPDLHDAWTRYGSFAYRYIDRITVKFSISSEAEEAFKEVKGRWGQVGDWSVWSLGKRVILEGDDAQNEKLLAFVEKQWVGTGPTSKELTFQRMSYSMHEKALVDTYLAKHNIDRNEFYKRVYLAGFYTLYNSESVTHND